MEQNVNNSRAFRKAAVWQNKTLGIVREERDKPIKILFFKVMKSMQSVSDFVTCCCLQRGSMLANTKLSGMVSATMASEGHDGQKRIVSLLIHTIS